MPKENCQNLNCKNKKPYYILAILRTAVLN